MRVRFDRSTRWKKLWRRREGVEPWEELERGNGSKKAEIPVKKPTISVSIRSYQVW